MRLEGFVDVASEHDLIVTDLASHGLHWTKALSDLGRKLKSLPKPLAVLGSREEFGITIIEAALEASLAVPEEVAVLAVGNDDLTCESLSIPLSSIDNNYEAIGLHAAELLERMINGESGMHFPALIPPDHEVITRLSSDVVAIPHLGVSKALQLIAHHFRDELRIEDMCRESDMSPASLHRAFKRYLGRTPFQEVNRVRIAESKRLLTSTSESIRTVGERSGYPKPWTFFHAFRKSTGMSPSAYRKSNRSDNPRDDGYE